MDSNHRNPKMTDLQSVPFNHSGTYPCLALQEQDILYREQVDLSTGNDVKMQKRNHQLRGDSLHSLLCDLRVTGNRNGRRYAYDVPDTSSTAARSPFSLGEGK